MKKRVFSAILTLCLLLTMMPTVAFAAEDDEAVQSNSVLKGNCGAGDSASSVTWKLTQHNEGNEKNPTYTLTISGNGAMADYDVGKAPWHVALREAANRKQINQIELSSGLRTSVIMRFYRQVLLT